MVLDLSKVLTKQESRFNLVEYLIETEMEVTQVLLQRVRCHKKDLMFKTR